MVWAADNTIWLLPAYTFGSADGGHYSVMLSTMPTPTGRPGAATTVPVIDPGVPVPATAPAADPAGSGADNTSASQSPQTRPADGRRVGR